MLLNLIANVMRGSQPLPEFNTLEEASRYFEVYINLLYLGVSTETATKAANEAFAAAIKEASCLKPH